MSERGHSTTGSAAATASMQIVRREQTLIGAPDVGLCGCCERSAESDALLRSCVTSLHAFITHLAAAAASDPAASILLLSSLSRVLALLVHGHPLVSDVGRGVWRLLHATMQPSFYEFATEIVLSMLQQSSGSGRDAAAAPAATAAAAGEAPNTQQQQRQWRMNAAQGRLIEALAQNAHTLPKQQQVSRERSDLFSWTSPHDACRSTVSLAPLVALCFTSFSNTFFVTSIWSYIPPSRPCRCTHSTRPSICRCACSRPSCRESSSTDWTRTFNSCCGRTHSGERAANIPA